MKQKIWLAAMVSAALLLSACGQTRANEGAAPEDGAEEQMTGIASYEDDDGDDLDLAEYDRLHTPVIYAGMARDSWDSPDQVEQDAFVVYYQYLASAGVVDRPEGEEYQTDDGEFLLPAAMLEAVVLERFDVPVEHIRQSRYYRGDADAYELMGIGGAWDCRIVGVEQSGDRLLLHFETTTGRGLPMGEGTLTAETTGDSVKYRSLTYRAMPSYLLEFPASTENEFVDGQFRSRTAGQATIMAESGESWDYDGEDLGSIVAFFQEMLEELGAEGEADTQSIADGWAWSGTYDGGRPVSIAVTPNESEEDEDGYRIAVEIEQ